jgi:ankyrin repeat protein
MSTGHSSVRGTFRQAGDVELQPHLHMTIENGDITLARVLLDAGADPGIRDDKYGATALGWADFFGREEFAKLVREHGGQK